MPPKPTSARAVATSILNRGGIVALNIATGILTARTLHPAGRGALAAMNLWPLFLANATALGTPSSLIYHLRRLPTRKAELIPSALTLVTALGALAALLGYFVLPHWLRQYPPEITHAAQLFLLVAPFWAIQITGQAALEAHELFALSNLVQIMIPVLTLTGLLGLLATGHMAPIPAALCYNFAIVPTALTILAMLWRRRLPHHTLAVTRAAWQTLLSYGVRSAPLDLLGTLNLYIDQVLVIGLLSAASMGSYAVVLSLSRALLVFQSAVVMVLFPKATGRPPAEILAMVGQAVRANVLLSGTAALATALLGRLVLRLFYGQQYLSAVPALRILVLEVVFQGAVVIVSQAFMAAGRPGIVSLLQGTGLALAVPLMFLFIPRFGVAGAALALLCSTLTRLTLLLVAIRRVLRQPLPRILPTPTDLQTLRTLARR